MTDDSRIEEEYEPADIDPDNPIAALPDDVRLPVEADQADWADQHRPIAEGDAEEDRR
jgi:hypothetical protein